MSKGASFIGSVADLLSFINPRSPDLEIDWIEWGVYLCVIGIAASLLIPLTEGVFKQIAYTLRMAQSDVFVRLGILVGGFIAFVGASGILLVIVEGDTLVPLLFLIGGIARFGDGIGMAVGTRRSAWRHTSDFNGPVLLVIIYLLLFQASVDISKYNDLDWILFAFSIPFCFLSLAGVISIAEKFTHEIPCIPRLLVLSVAMLVIFSYLLDPDMALSDSNRLIYYLALPAGFLFFHVARWMDGRAS